MSSLPPARRLILFAFVAVLLWLPALMALRSGRPDASFTAVPSIDARLSARPGVNLHASELTPAALEPTLGRLDSLGIDWVRLTLPWDEIEAQPGAFQWEPWDAAIAALAARANTHVVVVLDRSPVWARAEADAANPQAPPVERAAFGAFAREVARRYSTRVDDYQVWHEPNIFPHWGAQPVSPEGYVGLLREAALNIREADPGARVVLAALAPTTEAGGANLSEIGFLEGIYAAGGAAWFDAAAAQPYGFSSAPGEVSAPGALNFARASLLRAVMMRAGDGSTPVYAANWGWNGGAGSPWGSVEPGQQAEYLAEGFSIARREQPWLGPLFWPALCPRLSGADPLTGFSLCAGTTLTPAGEALAAATKGLPVLAEGRYPMDHPALQYGEGWRQAGGSADPPQTPITQQGGAAAAPGAGEPLTFTFYGTGFALDVQGGDYWGYATAEVDDEPASALPRDDNGAAYLVLHDPSAARRTIALATGLTLGEHTVRLTPAGGWGQWPLQAVVVTRAAPSTGPLPLLLAALAALGTLLAARFILPARRPGRRGVAPKAALLPRGRVPYLAGAAATLLRLLDRLAALPPTLLWLAAALLSLGLYFSRWPAADLALLAGLGILFLASPALPLPLIAASLPFWQQPKPLLGWEFGLCEVFAWLAVAAQAARGVLAFFGDRPGRTGRASVLDWAMPALFAAGTLSALLADEQGVAWREWRIVFLFGVAVYWLTRTAASNRATGVLPAGTRFSPLDLVTGLLAGAVIVSVIALYQLVTGNGRIDVEGVMRVRALYGSPNNLALVLDRAAPLALALATFGRGRARGLYAGAVVLVIAACVATFSKGALLLGLPAGIAVVLTGGAIRSKRRWPLALLAAVTVAALVGLILLFRTPRFADLLNFEAGTSFFRIKLWQGAFHMALDHPLLGVGPDNFLYAYRTRYVLPTAWQELNLSHPHNILLDLWTRIGLLGAVAGLWTLAAGIALAWRRFRTARDRWPLALGLLAVLIVTVTHGLIDNSLFLPDLMGWFALGFGLLASEEVWQDSHVVSESGEGK